jgi:nucleoside-diphosphate-sugar epimerase
MPSAGSSPVARARILVTGAAGTIGREIAPILRDHFSLRLLDVRRVRGELDDECVRADVRNLKAMRRACQGVQALVHLAGIAREADFAGELVPHNILGIHRAFEAARQAGVRNVVFASSIHTVLGYDEADGLVTTDMPIRPRSVYGCTKVFGEALARHYADRYGMSMICLRIGRFLPYDSPTLVTEADALSSWCSPRDLAQLVTRSIRSDLSFGVFFAVSDNPVPRWGIETARRDLGYAPVDNPADHRKKTEG